MHYRRSQATGATWFFTLTLANRRSRLLVEQAPLLRQVFRQVRERHPFDIVAMVVLPDHLHTIWSLPQGDGDYPMRWSLIKSAFSRNVPRTESISSSRRSKRERGLWQRRYWEHQIRDADDLQRHLDYIHYNPVKHGHVLRASDWPCSSIHRYIRQEMITADWAAGERIFAGADYGE